MPSTTDLRPRVARKPRQAAAPHVHASTYRVQRSDGSMTPWRCAECGADHPDQDAQNALWRANGGAAA